MISHPLKARLLRAAGIALSCGASVTAIAQDEVNIAEQAASLFVLLDAVELSTPPLPVPGGARALLGMVQCQQGSIETGSLRRQDVDSPWTERSFTLSTYDANACSYGFAFGFGDNSVSGSTRLHGPQAEGSISQDGERIGYARIGDGAGTGIDLTTAVTLSQSDTSSQQVSLDGVASLRRDSRESAVELELRYVGSYNGVYGLNTADGGQSGTFSLSLGKSDEALGVLRTVDTLALSGSYLLDFSPAPPEFVCPSARIKLSTVTPLVLGTGSSPYVGGELRVKADGKTASVAFVADGSVDLNVDGVITHYSYLQFLALAKDCSAGALAAATLLRN